MTKIAIIHDDFSVTGGGEKLLGLLARELNNKGFKTDIITFDISEETKKIIPNDINIITLKDNKYTKNDKGRELFAKLNLKNQYDLYLFSGHNCIYTAKNHKPNLLYNHNIPESELKKTNKKQKDKENKIHQTNLKLESITKSSSEKIWKRLHKLKNKFIIKKIPKKISFKLDTLRYLLLYILNAENIKNKIETTNHKENIKQIQKIIVNSKNIQNKIKNIYNKESIVIYPPIETSKYKHKLPKNYWLSINRITPLKRIELQLKTFSKLPKEKLFIIGNIENNNYYNFLKKQKPNNVTFLKTIPEIELVKKLSECKGLLFTAKDEDFGMSPVEAMASGKPVIAPNEGGYKETVTNKTGILIDDIDPDKIIRAINEINNKLRKDSNHYKKDSLKRAKKFDTEIFIKEIKKEINSTLNIFLKNDIMKDLIS
jgi:glycosyltransferase involved in cell wall biosynthesis